MCTYTGLYTHMHMYNTHTQHNTHTHTHTTLELGGILGRSQVYFSMLFHVTQDILGTFINTIVELLFPLLPDICLPVIN